MADTATKPNPAKAPAAEPTPDPRLVAEIGDVVLWYPDGDQDAPPHPAVVTALGLQSVSLNIMGPDNKNFRVLDGVHHITDPYCRRIETREAGGWSHTPRTLTTLQLLESLK